MPVDDDTSGTDHLAGLGQVHVGSCRDQADWAPV